MFHCFLFLILMVSSSLVTVHARIRLAVSIIQEVGYEENMILRSELHSFERVGEGKTISLQMSEGVRFDFSAWFFQREDDYGPSPYVLVKGTLYDENGRLINRLEGDDGLIKIGENKITNYNFGLGKKIEISLTPKINQ